MKQQTVYLPGLNGIRAIAAIAVIVSHIGLNLQCYGIPNLSGYSLANFGVTMFFALSGFLITYLLLAETKKTQKIDIKKFYIRRILRIWPLYYGYIFCVLLVVGFVVDKNFAYYLFMFPNIPFAVSAAGGALATFPYLAHYWSVGVEEQFYAFWPWIIRCSRYTLLTLLILCIAFFVLKMALSMLGANKVILSILHYTRFGCLSLGGIFAYLFFTNNNLLHYLRNPISELIAWGIVLAAGIGNFHIFSIIDHEVFACVTLVIIINQVSNPKRIVSLENKVFDYLGKISYGLYVYNPLVIYLVSLALKPLIIKQEASILNYLIIYSTTIVSVIAVSHLSYYFFERKILKLKGRFATVNSASSSEDFNYVK